MLFQHQLYDGHYNHSELKAVTAIFIMNIGIFLSNQQVSLQYVASFMFTGYSNGFNPPK